MGSRRSRLSFAPILLAALTLGGVALAEPSAADKETARGLMATGRKDRDKGDLQGALKAFTAADAIMRVPTTGLEVARSQAALGLLVEARDTALQVTRSPVAPKEPTPFKAARDAATALSEELEGRIPSLTVTVKNVPDGANAEVTIDGATVPPETTGQARKLDPGHHVVTAKAGTAEAKQEVDLAERDAKSVAVELPGSGAAAASTDATSSDAQPATESSERSPAAKALLIGGFGVAGVGLIVGSITGALSLSKTGSIKSSAACEGSVCNPSEDGDIGSARTMAAVSTVSFIVAGAGAVAGVVGFLMKGSSAPTTGERAPEAWISPTFGLGSLGVRGRF